MQIIEKKIDELIPYEFNNKIHDEVQVNRIANSIKEFGFTQPLVVDKNNVVIIGHGRLEASKKLGLTEVPCYIMEDLSETQIKKLRILDNKLNESEYDLANLKMELDSLEDLSFGDLDLKAEDLFPEFKSGEEYYNDLGEEESEEEQIQEQKEITIQVIAKDEVEAQLIKADLDNLGYTYK